MAFLFGFDAPPPRPLERARRRILVVEDDPRLREAMRAHISRMGIDVVGVPHYAAAHDYLAVSTPDLACIDIGLPSESGYELCECIRGPLGLEALPILVTSAFGSARERAYAEEAGANA